MCVNVQIFSTLENYMIQSKKREYWLDGLINIFMNISAFASCLHIQTQTHMPFRAHTHFLLALYVAVWDTLLIQYLYGVWSGHM